MAGDVVLEVRNLVKRFGTITAVDGLDLDARGGEVVGLLGPNGAGKSTTIGVILGLIRADSGSVRIAGHDVRRAPETALSGVGAIIETPTFYPYLSGRANLTALALIRGGDAAARIDPLLERMGLAQRARSPYRTYSLGMRQRLGIASTLLNDPALVILDEPANGLDPAGQREIRSLIRELAHEGRAVLLASHLLHEVEQVCDRVVVINRGRLVKSGQMADVTRGGSTYEITVADPARAATVLRDLPAVSEVQTMPHGLRVAAGPGHGEALNRALFEAGIVASALVPQRTSLEEVFLQLTEGNDGPPAS